MHNVDADEQRSAAESIYYKDMECLLQPLVRLPAGGQADTRTAATFTRPHDE